MNRNKVKFAVLNIARYIIKFVYLDCMTVWSEEGHLYYKSRTNDPTVCGIYITAKPEQTVHVYFDYVDVPCNSGGLIAVRHI